MTQQQIEGAASPQAALQIVEKEVPSLQKRAESIQLTDQASLEFATETASIASRLLKKLEEKRQELVTPLNEEVRVINAQFKKAGEPLEAIKKAVKAKLASYMDEQDRKRREEEARLKRLADEQRKRELEEAAKNRPAAPTVALAIPTAKAPEQTIQSQTGAASTKKVWKWKLVDIAKVPQPVLRTNDVEINAAIRDGKREIPGLEIYQETQIAVR